MTTRHCTEPRDNSAPGRLRLRSLGLFEAAVLVTAAALLPGCPPPSERVLCTGKAATKGPWVMRAGEREATVFWESRESGCSEVELSLEDGSGKRIVEGAAADTEVTVVHGREVQARPPDVAGNFAIHSVRVDGLEPGTRYRYRTSAEAHDEGRFCTARPPGSPFKFMAIGDTAAVWGFTEKVVAAGLARQPDFIVHGGDLQYFTTFQESWASWFEDTRPLFAAGAFFPAVGNHEFEIPNEFDAYYSRFFAEPGQVGTTRWYRFATGGVHFFSVDTESSFAPGSAQRTWLEAELAAVKSEPGYRFSVVFFHKPIYALGRHGPRLDLRKELQPLIEANDVKLVIQAHVHGYERFEVNGVTYLVTGGGGAPLYDMDEEVSQHPLDEPLRKFRARQYHSVIVSVGEKLSGEVVNETGAVIDTF